MSVICIKAILLVLFDIARWSRVLKRKTGKFYGMPHRWPRADASNVSSPSQGPSPRRLCELLYCLCPSKLLSQHIKHGDRTYTRVVLTQLYTKTSSKQQASKRATDTKVTSSNTQNITYSFKGLCSQMHRLITLNALVAPSL